MPPSRRRVERDLASVDNTGGTEDEHQPQQSSSILPVQDFVELAGGAV